MPSSLTFRTRLKQPPDATPLNGKHPLFGQVRLALTNAGTVFDSKRCVMLTNGTSASFKGTGDETAQEFSGTNTVGTALAAGLGFSAIVPSGSLPWCVIRFRINSLGTRRCLFADFSSGGAAHSIRLEQQAADTYLFGVAAGAVSYTVTGPAVTLGWHTAAMWIGGDSKPRISIDGGSITVGSTAMSSARDAGTDLRLGSAGGYSLLPFDGGVSALIFGGGATGESATTGGVSEGALIELSRNPWALWEDELDWNFFAAASPYPTLSAATVTAITSTGATPRVTITI